MHTAHGQIARDPTAAVECHRPDDRFIPLRIHDLLRGLEDEFIQGGGDAKAFQAFANSLRDVAHQEAVAFERELANHYSHFNPDRDTLPVESDAAVRTPEGYASLYTRLNYLLDKANFERLRDFDVERVVRAANTHGLRVRLYPERIEELTIWLRGHGRMLKRRRTWRHPLKGEPVPLDVFRRLVVVAQLKDDPHVIVKIFKDIPEDDVEALLPHAEVEMTLLDRVTMFGGGAGALGSTATKVIPMLSAGLFLLSRLLWVVLVGGCVLFYRTFMGYRRARANRDGQRTRNLYYYNVANNAGAVHLLIDMIAQEEFKEAVLAYVMCRRRSGFADAAQAGTAVENYLRRRFGLNVDFDVGDAVKTLTRLDLWADRAALRVVEPAEAIRRLDEQWRARRCDTRHAERAIEAQESARETPAAATVVAPRPDIA